MQNPRAERHDEPALLRDVNELRRRQQPAGGVLPTHQRLETRGTTCVEVHDGLVAQQERAIGHGSLQFRAQGEAVHDRGV
jgi:hypothetical protein